MTRTTISLHESVLRKVKRLSHDEHTTMGETITELLNLGLRAKENQMKKNKKKFQLKSFSLGTPRVPLEDKDAIYSLLTDEEK